MNSSNNINAFVFYTLTFMFTIWRRNKSTITHNKFKKQIRCLGSFFIFVTIFSSVLYNSIIYYLNDKIDINKYDFELGGFYKKEYFFNFYNFKLDLVEMLNISYMISKIFRMSAVFLLIGLVSPSIYSFNKENLNMSFSRIYSILRIPLLLFIYYKLKTLDYTKLIFFESFILGAEIYICLVFILMLKTKNKILNNNNNMDTLTLLGVVLFLFSFLNYTINSLALPFTYTTEIYDFKNSLVFALKLIIDIIVVCMFCPLKEQIVNENEVAKEYTIEVGNEMRQMVLYH